MLTEEILIDVEGLSCALYNVVSYTNRDYQYDSLRDLIEYYANCLRANILHKKVDNFLFQLKQLFLEKNYLQFQMLITPFIKITLDRFELGTLKDLVDLSPGETLTKITKIFIIQELNMPA